MPCHTRMKIILLRGLFWLYLMKFGFMVASLEPGFLDFDNLPDTNFSCVGKVIGGYYADLETSCQMFHVCTIGQLDEPMDIRFLCLNGTVFDQETRVCERIDEVDCSKSEQFYSLNLELYGNTQPPILEDTSDLEPTEILKQPSSSTTTSTTPRPSKPKTTRQSFIITTTPRPPTTTLQERLLQPHRFPGSNSADIRFNPEEINISLNPGAPPNIRPNNKPISFQQSINDNNKRVIVTTHTTLYKSEVNPPPVTASPQIKIAQSPKPKPIVNYGSARDEAHNQHRQQIEDSYNYDSYQTEKIMDYESELSTHSFQFRPNIPNFRPSSRDIQHYSHKPEYKPSTYRSHYHPTTLSPPKNNYNHRNPTTYRNIYSSPLKPSIPYYHRTEKPPRIQLPLPMVPTLSPLTFSSPAPFSLNRHVESKRFADHHQPPRIVISASASVSDASGRKFNYSLGTIGDSRLFSQAPNSYDEYKEEHVGLDPFYHDVPKLTRLKRNNYYYRRRYKRSTLTDEKTNNVTRTPTKDEENEAIDVLKFLFDWYSNYNKSTEVNFPIDSESITEINDELTPSNITVIDEYYYEDLDSTTKVDRKREYNTQQSPINTISNLQLMKPPKKDEKFAQRTRHYNVSEGIVSVTEIRRSDTVTPIFESEYNSQNYEYVDDNYEPQTYNEHLHNSTTEYYDYEDQEIPTITTENTVLNKTLKNPEIPTITTENALLNKTLKNQTEKYDNVLKILGITTNNPVKNNTDKINGSKLNNSMNSTHFSKGNKSDYYEFTKESKVKESNVNETRNNEPSKQYSDDVLIYEDFDSKNNNYDEQYYKEYDEELGTINNTSTTLEKHEKITERNKNFTSVAYEKFLEKHSGNDSQDNISEKVVKDLNIYNYETTHPSFSENNKYETATATYNTTSENSVTYSTMPTIIVTDSPTTRIEESITTTQFTTPVDIITTEYVTIPTTPTIATTIAKVPFETTTPGDYTTQYFTTENIMFTSVQLQKFIEGVESETKSIVDSKSVSDTTTEIINITPMNFDSNSEKSNKLMEAMIQTTSIPTTTEIAETPTTKYFRTRNPTRRNSFRGSHRFGSSTIKPQRRKPSITEEIVDVIKNKKDTLDELKLGKEKIEFNINAYTANLAYRNRNGETTEEIPVTAPSFSKSANPTIAKEPKDYLSTTPISKSFRLNVHKQIKSRNYVFNCFGRDINKFYSDPRDCRLFHYCTQGFTKTQLLDMKFVCDLGTYFDDEKLICTKIKPSRCT